MTSGWNTYRLQFILAGGTKPTVLEQVLSCAPEFLFGVAVRVLFVGDRVVLRIADVVPVCVVFRVLVLVVLGRMRPR